MLAFLLLATVTGGVATGEAPLQFVTYDVSDLLPTAGAESRGLRIMPFPLFDDAPEPDLDDERFDDVPQVLAELLTDCVARDALQLEGCSLEVRDGRLELVAPEPAQHDAAALVALLRGGLRREAVVRLELLRAKDAGPVDPAGIDAALAAGRLQRVVSRTETVWVGSTAECSAETHRRIVVDVEPEIAHKAAIGRPALLDLATGLHALLRVEAAPGGRLTLRCAARISELRSLPARSDGLQLALTGDGGQSRTPMLSTFERPDVAFATLAASGRVQPGDTLVAAVGSETAQGPSAWVLRLSLASVAPASGLAESADGEHVVGLFDISRQTWPRTHVPRPTAAGMSPDFLGNTDPYENTRAHLVFPAEWPQATDWLDVRLQAACAQVGAENAWLLRRGNWLLACSSREGLSAIAATLEGLEPSAADVVVTLLATRQADGGGRLPVASLRLPLRPDDAALAWAGSEGLSTVTYDVDVAESAAIPDPWVAGFVDGLGLRITSARDGRPRVDLVLHRVLGWERVSLGASGIEAYERPVRGVVTFARDLVPGGVVRLEGLGDPFSPLASLALEIGAAAR